MRFIQWKTDILIILLLILVGRAYTQQTDPIVSLNLDNKKISEVLTELTSVSGIEFSYNPSRIGADSLISVSFTNTPLTEILNSLTQYGITFRYINNHIILRRSKRSIRAEVFTPRKFTISGYIKDNIDGEVLIGATVGDPGKGYGVAANEYGYYSLTIPEGDYSLTCSYIGYEVSDIQFSLSEDKNLDILLNQSVSRLDEVIVVANSTENIVARMSSGQLEIRERSIKRIPGMLGESDVLKSIQSLPGISFYSDGSTIFHVRGGDRDQNLILIDEAPIYNPAHLLGLFSAFTPESLNSINIYRGDMPASYGGRLSSVIDVRLKDGNSNALVFSGNTGMVATTLNLEGPMFGDKSSFYLSARRSHLKWITDINNASVDKLHFSDFNLKYNFRINRKNRILLSYYSGLDMFRSVNRGSGASGITWVNNAGNLRWNHLFGEKLFSNTSLIISNYDYNLYTNYEAKERWNTGVGMAALKTDFSFYPGPRATYKAGLYLATHVYSPGNYYIGYNAQPVTRGVSVRTAYENAIYISGENRIGSRLFVNFGIRFTGWQNGGPATEYIYDNNSFPSDTLYYGKKSRYNTYTSFEPRITLKYDLSKRVSAKLSWTNNSQFEYLISNSISPFTSLETWLPASPNIKPMRSGQLTGGIVAGVSDNTIIFGVEGFIKNMHNYMGYIDHAYMLFNPHVESEIRYGKGRSYGVELMIKKPDGLLNGWMAYSFSRTKLNIPGINNNNSYPAGYDRPHSINIYLNYQARPRWNISSTWTYSTGNPITTPTGYYFYNGYQIPFYDSRNNDRLPDYHRLDISSEFTLNQPGAKYKHSLKFSIFNLYGSKNPFTVNFNKIVKDSGALVVPIDHQTPPELVSSMMYIYGIMPSFSYHFEF